jgi:transposase-like protein
LLWARWNVAVRFGRSRSYPRKGDVQKHVREHVLAGSAIFTDALKSYDGLSEFQPEVIDHAVSYVEGEIHTNGRENFWSLLERGLHGTYISVEPFHLFRYLDEQAFRFNKRHTMDADRFVQLCSNVVGKRLDWKLSLIRTAWNASTAARKTPLSRSNRVYFYPHPQARAMARRTTLLEP